MPSLGYALIIVGVLLARQVMVGRATNTGEDLRDAALGFLAGDVGKVRDAFSRRGGGVAGVVDSSSSYPDVQTGGSGSTLGIAVMNAAIARGSKAKGYIWGTTGPDYYDCSGLIWRACQDAGVYRGPRFTSSSYIAVMGVPRGNPITGGKFAISERVTTPAAGDIILWQEKHIGVATGVDAYYSARSPSKGIGGASISGDAGYFGTQPLVYRIVRKG